MEWFRRLLGFPDRQGTEGNPFGSPTWDDIVAKKNSQHTDDSNDKQQPWGHFFQGGFHSDGFFSPPQEFEDFHSSLFSQMDEMFSHLDSMMRELHRHPAWALPDVAEEPEPQTPRDYMLKVPDTEPSGTETGPVPHNPLYGYDGEDKGHQSDHDDFGGQPFIFNPHSLLDRIFGMHPGDTPFSGRLPDMGSAPDLGEHSRQSLIKREDSDIDERVSGDLSKLPEGRPGYSHELPQAPDSSLPPQPHPGSPRSQPGVRHKFYSQSVVTIRKSDGTIEETRKYTDSSGREEVTVTHTQPDSGGIVIQSDDSAAPSLFSWFFTR